MNGSLSLLFYWTKGFIH